MDPQVDKVPLEQKPGILMIGSPNVGKRTLLSRLLCVDFEDASESSSGLLGYGWTISTKYYSADVSVWMTHLDNGFSIGSPPISQLVALVMVFDISDLSSFAALQDWVSHSDIQKFDILLCIGNKVDLLPGHFAHSEYRRRLQRRGECSGDPQLEFLDYGILETEGSSLLSDEEPSWEIRRSCLEWCSQHNIEYVEACASNADFDKCLSIEGDSQGVERLYGALSAHMWPGMILQNGNKLCGPCPLEKQELSEEESDYEIEYEILSAGSAEPWDHTDDAWVSSDGHHASTDIGTGTPNVTDNKKDRETNGESSDVQPSNCDVTLQKDIHGEIAPKVCENGKSTEPDDGTHLGFQELEQLMSEIGNMRGNLRLMPDFQRREMAAKLAMKMAAMFGDSSGDEEGFE